MKFSSSLLALLFTAKEVHAQAADRYKYNETELVEFKLQNAYLDSQGNYQDIQGFYPADVENNFPLYIHIPGTFDQWPFSGDIDVKTKDMARRGFVAAAVAYNNQVYPYSCDNFIAKSRALFDPSLNSSAVSLLCNPNPNEAPISQLNCGEGIAVEGFSQGANLANLAHNYNKNVIAIYLVGNVEPTNRNCWDKANTTIPANRIQSFMGINDQYANDNSNFPIIPPPPIKSNPKESLASTTGLTDDECTDYNNCLQSDGSGYYIVDPTQMSTGNNATHCYMWKKSSCTRKSFTRTEKLYDPEYFPNENVYGMYQSHDWLAKFFFADDAGAGRELNGVDASKAASNPNSGKDGTCNFCGGRGELILKDRTVEKLLSTISATLGADKNKFIGYAKQTSCSEIQDALNKNVKGIKKGECITLKGVYSVLSALPGATATTCPIGCSEGKQFLPKQEVSVNDLTEAFGITFVGQSEEESMTCDNLYSHVKQASSYGMPYGECQAFKTAAEICCVTRGKKKGKPFGD